MEKRQVSTRSGTISAFGCLGGGGGGACPANIETEDITSGWPDRGAFVVVVVARVPSAGKMEIIFRATSVDA